jgi:hypothetical protein
MTNFFVRSGMNYHHLFAIGTNSRELFEQIERPTSEHVTIEGVLRVCLEFRVGSDRTKGPQHGASQTPAIPDALLNQLLDGADPRTAFNPNGVLDALKKR